MESILVLVPYLTLLIFVFLTQVLILCHHCYRRSRGYLWRTARSIWPYLVTVFIMQSLLAFSIYEFLLLPLLQRDILFHEVVGAGLSGFLAVSVPEGTVGLALKAYLTRTKADLSEDLSRSFNRLLLRTWVAARFKAAVQDLKSRDNFQAQWQLGWWDLRLCNDKQESEQLVGRRLRRLYEAFKLEIANQERSPYLLDIAGGYYPGNKLFLLVAYLGRARLRELLADPPPSPSPGNDWNGSERRLRRGTKADRRQPDHNHMYSRISDDEALRHLVAQGRFMGE